MAAPITVTVDAKGIPQPPVDPNVVIPPSVRAATAAAEAAHARAYAPQPDPAATQVTPQPDPSPVQNTPQPEPAKPAPAEPDRSNWDAAQWMHHAKSMEGRWKQERQNVTALQGQVTELGDELIRTQAIRQPVQQDPNLVVPPPVTPQPVQKHITNQDVEQYGEDFLSVAQRAALDATAPIINRLELQNRQLERKLRQNSIQTISQVLDAAIPNWGQINLSPRFKAWLRLRDGYSGKVRQELLTEAHKSADADRVLKFFKGFLAEEEATGNTEFLPSQEPSPSATLPNPAVELTTLAAPGHAKPAPGTSPNSASASNPIWITRAQISDFYNNVRKGVYIGREQDYHNDQAIIFECQRHGRVR